MTPTVLNEMNAVAAYTLHTPADCWAVWEGDEMPTTDDLQFAFAEVIEAGHAPRLVLRRSGELVRVYTSREI